MTSTRTQIRQEAAARLGSLAVPYPTTAASGTTTTAVVTELIDSTASEYDHVGGWAYFLSPSTNLGQVRRIQSYAPDSGTLTFNRALPLSIAANHTFEIHSWFDPRIWNDCINRALDITPRMRRESLTVIANQTEYPLATYPWITTTDQILRLILRVGSTPGEYTYSEIHRPRWSVTIDQDVLTLLLTWPFGSIGSNEALFFEANGPYDRLTADTASTTCALDWIAFGSIKQAYDVYGKIIDDSNKKGVLIDQDTAIKRHQQLTRQHAPRLNPVLRLQPPGRI